MQWKDVKGPPLAYLQRRLSEPESRVAIGAAVAALAAWGSGQITGSQLEIAEIGALITFLVPGPIAKDILDAIEKPAPPKP